MSLHSGPAGPHPRGDYIRRDHQNVCTAAAAPVIIVSEMQLFALLLLSLVLTGPGARATTPAAAAQGETAGYYFLAGRHFENEGRIDEAIAALRKAIELAPKAAEPYGELAGLYARQNRAGDALEAASAALALDPDNREANRILGTVYGALSEQGRALRPGDDPEQYLPLAIEALEKSRRSGGSEANVELMLGRLYTQAGEPDKAIDPLRRIVDDYPGYPEAAMMLANSYAETGQLDEAVRTLEEAIDTNPGFFRGRIRLGEIYEEQRRFPEAAATYAAARAVNPRVDLTTPHATALINAGEPGEAATMLRGALDGRARPDPAHLYLLGQAERRMGDRAAAAATAARFRETFPDDLRGVYLEAQLAGDGGRPEDAIKAYATLIAAVPDDPTFVYQYAHFLDRAGRPADAERALRDLLARSPDDANAMNSLGYMFAVRGERLEEAVELLRRALEIEPGNPSYLDSLGWAYFQQGRDDLADAPLTQAAAALPRVSVVQEHLGDLRYRQKRYADAAAAWERALAGDGEDIDRAALEKKLQDARSRLVRE
jgi:tetratricopeptide (TPR) repeat protein